MISGGCTCVFTMTFPEKERAQYRDAEPDMKTTETQHPPPLQIHYNTHSRNSDGQISFMKRVLIKPQIVI